MNKIIELFTQRFAGRVATKAVSLLAGVLLAHGYVTDANKDAWVKLNSEVVAGLITVGISFLLSKWQHKQVETAKQIALYTEPPAAPPAPEVAAKLPTFGGPTRTLPLLACLLSAVSLATASEPAPVTNPESAAALVRAVVDTIGEQIDLGGTITVKPSQGWANSPSVSVLGQLPGCQWSPNERITLAVGLTYSYSLQWEEHFAGIGGTVTLFETPAVVLAAKNAVPVADVTLPRMTRVKAFLSVQTRVPEALPALSAGLTVPF